MSTYLLAINVEGRHSVDAVPPVVEVALHSCQCGWIGQERFGLCLVVIHCTRNGHFESHEEVERAAKTQTRRNFFAHYICTHKNQIFRANRSISAMWPPCKSPHQVSCPSQVASALEPVTTQRAPVRYHPNALSSWGYLFETCDTHVHAPVNIQTCVRACVRMRVRACVGRM